MCRVILQVCPTIFGKGDSRKLHLHIKVEVCSEHCIPHPENPTTVWNFEAGALQPYTDASNFNPPPRISWEIQQHFYTIDNRDWIRANHGERGRMKEREDKNCASCTDFSRKVGIERMVRGPFGVLKTEPGPVHGWVRWSTLPDVIRNELRREGREAKKVFCIHHQPELVTVLLPSYLNQHSEPPELPEPPRQHFFERVFHR